MVVLHERGAGKCDQLFSELFSLPRMPAATIAGQGERQQGSDWWVRLRLWNEDCLGKAKGDEGERQK